MSDPKLRQLLFQALGTEGGIVVRVSNVEQARQAFYRERKAAGPALDPISIVVSRTNPDTELWLMNRSTPGAEEIEPTPPSGSPPPV